MGDDFEFTSVAIPESNITRDFEGRYRVIGKDGRSVEVSASCAADAVTKSGIYDPVKIENVLVEKYKLLDENVISLSGNAVEIDCSAASGDEDSKGLGFLFVEELAKEEAKQEVEEFQPLDLGRFSEVAAECKKLVELPEIRDIDFDNDSGEEDRDDDSIVDTVADDIDDYGSGKAVTEEDVSPDMDKNVDKSEKAATPREPVIGEQKLSHAQVRSLLKGGDE